MHNHILKRFTEKTALVKLTKGYQKKTPTRQVNVDISAGKRYCKQYSVKVTFICKPVNVYMPKLAVAFCSYFR